nr:protein FRA10AC1 homolog [Ciona intestinalis]|eukprot:XP_002125901.1 protein FRA10AC1 homolog [Ciona intestinalis]
MDYNIGSYGSEFSESASGSEVQQNKINKQRNNELYKKPDSGRLGLLHHKHRTLKPSKRSATDLVDIEEGKRMRYHGLLAMDAYQRHKKLVNDYLFLYGGKRSDFTRDSSKDKTDHDVIKENHRFLWEEEESEKSGRSWEEKLAYKYWSKLYKEYTICDLAKYKENKIALRWRIEKEVISGKGQFICSNTKCDEREGLRTWEVNFKYTEGGGMRNTLVKSRLCPECSYKLNYRHKKRDVTKKIKKPDRRKDKMKKIKSEEIETSDPSTSSRGGNPRPDDDDHIWTKPIPVEDTKSREDEFEDYFDGLFL